MRILNYLFYASIVALFVTLAYRVGPINIYTFDVFFLPFICVMLMSKVIYPERFGLTRHKMDALILLLFAFVTVSFLLSTDIKHSLDVYMDWIRIVSVYFMSRIVFENTPGDGGFRKYIILSFYFLLAVGLVQVATGRPIGLIGNYFGEGFQQERTMLTAEGDKLLRVSGTTMNPIVYSIWLIMLCPLPMVIFIAKKQYVRFSLIVAVVLMVIVNTFSRGALMTFVIIVLWTAVLQIIKMKKRYLPLAVIGSALMVVVMYFAFDAYYAKFASDVKIAMLKNRIMDIDQASNHVRVEMIGAGMRIIQEPRYLLAGIGAGNFHRVSSDMGMDVRPNPWMDYSESQSGIHNVYMKVLVEYGVIVFILYFAVQIVFMKNVIAIYRDRHTIPDKEWAEYIISAYLPIMIFAYQVYEEPATYHYLIPFTVLISFVISKYVAFKREPINQSDRWVQ